MTGVVSNVWGWPRYGEGVGRRGDVGSSMGGRFWGRIWLIVTGQRNSTLTTSMWLDVMYRLQNEYLGVIGTL
ncbi:hypothetical protein VN97_g5294 [Penicillium thymicola]|uniref:Uncharacterized protein n=1 Tax=Penicillium thymicola TaxID=293382 RepID=A0AAI9TJR6_PENTH|nr:hypothetical protein VN97_g5294 [Penicillium thymicola]